MDIFSKEWIGWVATLNGDLIAMSTDKQYVERAASDAYLHSLMGGIVIFSHVKITPVPPPDQIP